ncbi:SNF2 family N-terminal domain-containing protein [Stachybotrys elegans]|uniref:SNF2 family N-terminal domain-containing protein n=1 Tax=Stachybotrys elegans TaxID=80388 RepID=A0A8K0SFP7_9HYPO|nr:SNF2 family N-terminal domain-containing protein [Stachybotrys elegans]
MSDRSPVGKIGARTLECLSKIRDEQGVHIQFMMSNSNSFQSKSRAASRKSGVIGWASVIIYGPADLAEDIGVFLDKCGYCLQDPYGCDRNVLYKNPHCISTLFEEPQLTFALSSPNNALSMAFSASDSLMALQTNDAYLEWTQPEDIATKLTRYQLQALWFFLMREEHKNWNRIWQRELSPNNPPIYRDQITKMQSPQPPSIWSGGILADEMGLGKTLQMISLIAASKAQESDTTSASRTGMTPSTLVILPPPLLDTWEYQLTKHVKKGRLSWTRYHGAQRLQQDDEYPDVVLTTYHKVQHDFRRSNSCSSALFRHKWRRIILDEAHIIRNMKTSTSLAVCSLKAHSRWAVTGTPVQNGLQDLRGLLHFLQFHPYGDPHVLDNNIFSHLNGDTRDEGLRRFKTLFQTILIRRPAAMINLPDRQDLTRTIDFSAAELRWYREVELSHIVFDEMSDGSQSGHQGIQTIDKLRRVCNLGLAASSTDFKEQRSLPSSSLPTTRIVYELYTGGTECSECRSFISPPDAEEPRESCPVLYYSSCLQILCLNCSKRNSTRNSPDCICGPGAVCALQPLVLGECMGVADTQAGALSFYGLSSKARAVVEEIWNARLEKHVVLSFWRTSLDMIQQGLHNAGIQCARVDGSMKGNQRHAVLERFRNDIDITVILLTVSCGGVGLDLTAASRIHLVEPQWNPAIEQQAMARVYRMGQKKPVVTMRYMMRDSIEESVVSCQGRKEQIAKLLSKY